MLWFLHWWSGIRNLLQSQRNHHRLCRVPNYDVPERPAVLGLDSLMGLELALLVSDHQANVLLQLRCTGISNRTWVRNTVPMKRKKMKKNQCKFKIHCLSYAMLVVTMYHTDTDTHTHRAEKKLTELNLTVPLNICGTCFINKSRNPLRTKWNCVPWKCPSIKQFFFTVLVWLLFRHLVARNIFSFTKKFSLSVCRRIFSFWIGIFVHNPCTHRNEAQQSRKWN